MVSPLRLPPRAPAWAIALASALLAGLLAWWRLGRRSFWFDEVVSATTVDDWATYVQRLTLDQFNGLYYTLLRGWSVLGHDEVALRGMSVAFAMLSAPVFYLLVRMIFGRTTAVISTLLLCINAFFIHYAQEARPSALALLLVTLATLLLLLALERRDPRWRAAYALTAALSMYAHFFAAFVIAAHTLYVLYRRRLDRPWVLIYVAIGIASAPLVWAVLFASKQLDWIPATSPTRVLQALTPLAGGSRGISGIILVGLYGSLAGFAIWTIVRERRRSPERGQRLVLMWLGLSVVAPVAVSVWKPDLIAHYFIVALPALVVLVGAGIARLPGVRLRAMILSGVFLLAIGGLWHGYTMPYQDWRAAVAHVRTVIRDADRIFVIRGNRTLVFSYYAQRLAPGPPLTPVPLPDLSEQPTVIPTLAGGRTWIVIADTDADDKATLAAFERQLRALGFARIDDRDIGTITLHLWQPPAR